MLNPEQKLNPKIGQADIEQVPSRNGFGEGLLHLGEHDPNVVALTGDLAESTRVLDFAKKYPERFVECGVAEQNMMGVAAGMALAGKTPFVASYATFSPGRSWDQLRVSVAYSKANVKVAGSHTGLSVGPDGATHQALEDIAITRVIPNMTVVVPCDAIEARKTTIALGSTAGPAYFRLGREKTPLMTSEETPFQVGKAAVFKEGKDVAIIGAGPILYNGLQAALELEKQGVSVLVINNHTIKPLDTDMIVWAATLTSAVVTLEEHQVTAGVGSAIAECLAQHYPVPIEMVGVPDSFGESGQPEELLQKFNMHTQGIMNAVHKVLQRKK